ncbi:unnamed protein product [Timema podura]|uniref:Uncharacterized protein n=1 Tax=Timema podura TaxID=61482 RepID=A0ABN7NNI5_TIMPD|nr:unnamed protein product [Timema podura]
MKMAVESGDEAGEGRLTECRLGEDVGRLYTPAPLGSFSSVTSGTSYNYKHTLASRLTARSYVLITLMVLGNMKSRHNRVEDACECVSSQIPAITSPTLGASVEDKIPLLAGLLDAHSLLLSPHSLVPDKHPVLALDRLSNTTCEVRVVHVLERGSESLTCTSARCPGPFPVMDLGYILCHVIVQAEPRRCSNRKPGQLAI